MQIIPEANVYEYPTEALKDRHGYILHYRDTPAWADWRCNCADEFDENALIAECNWNDLDSIDTELVKRGAL